MSRYSKIILVIAFIDLVLTVWLINQNWLGPFRETNPILNLLCKDSDTKLITTAKIATVRIILTAVSLTILEFVWNHRKKYRPLLRRCYFLAITGYMLIYPAGVVSWYLYDASFKIN